MVYKFIERAKYLFLFFFVKCFIIARLSVAILNEADEKLPGSITQNLFMQNIDEKDMNSMEYRIKTSTNYTLESDIHFSNLTDFLTLSLNNFTRNNSITTQSETLLPSIFDSLQKINPSLSPSSNPSLNPSSFPSLIPSISPSRRPSSSIPSKYPSIIPSESFLPSSNPTPICHDLCSYKNPLTQLGCMSHRGNKH